MKQIIRKSNISGKIVAKSSKSCEQRVLAASLLSRGDCIISNFGSSDDARVAREIAKKLGLEIYECNDVLKLTPSSANSSNEIHCGESGMNARLFAPISCLFKSSFVLTGSGSLLNRPVASDFYIFRQMGCILDNSDFLPINFERTQLQSGTYNIDGSKSSQLISGLMMTLAVLPGNSELIVHNPVSISYIYLTQRIMDNAGVKCSINSNEFGNLIINISGNQTYQSGNFNIEGDWSGAANFLVAAAITGQVEIGGLSAESIQADKNILKILDLANVSYHFKDDLLIVVKSEIKPFTFDATNCPDLIPTTLILACFADGVSKISGANRLINKESSRAEVMKQELQKTGINIEIIDDEIIINPTSELKPAIFDSHNDHRIAMALSVLGIAIDGESTIENSECVNKSWSDYFKDLKTLLNNNE